MPRFTRFSEKWGFFKSEIWAKRGQLTTDAIALNFLTELDSTDCSMGFGEINF